MSDRLLFCVLPAVTMSLGWGLRGTIGGGPVGAMIPGAMVTLCLCHLLRWRRGTAIAAAFGTIGVALGGQMTYGQTIGFVHQPETVWWGLLGLTTKGAVWGLSGGVLVGLGFMHSRYKSREILIGLLLMIAGTAIGRAMVDAPKLMYFSNRLDKPREELWFGLTLGAAALLMYLLSLRRERVSSAFALAGLIGGGWGFGGGGLFIWLGSVLDAPYRSWPWWKMMEFHFGLCFGLALGIIAFRLREILVCADGDESNATSGGRTGASLLMAIGPGWLVAAGGLWLQFTVPYRAMFTVVGACLMAASLSFPRLAWHVTLSLTITGFVRDWLLRVAWPEGLESPAAGWGLVGILAVPTVLAVSLAEAKGRLTAGSALLGLTALGTLFGLIKIGVPIISEGTHLFVPLVFVVEAVLIAVMTVRTDATITLEPAGNESVR